MNNKNNSSKTVAIISLTTLGIVLVILIAGFMYILGRTDASNSNQSKTNDAPSATISATVTPTSSPTSKPTPVPTPKPASEDDVQFSLYVVGCETELSIRPVPDTNVQRIDTIPVGGICGFIEKASVDGFYKVLYNGVTGYALSQYLNTSPTTIVDNTIPNKPVILTVSDCEESIGLYPTEDVTSEKIIDIPLNGTVEYLDVANNGFSKVRYNSLVGYAVSKYLIQK